MARNKTNPIQSELTDITAGLYIRVSTDAQAEEGYSIEAQKGMLEGYCRSRNITDFQFYIDGGFTGSNMNRPELQRLIHDIEQGYINAVVVYKLDRLSRSQRDTLYLIEDVLNPHGAHFVSLQESIDTATPMGRAIIGILSAFAQLERETIHERTKMGMLQRLKQGYWPGGDRTPLGYTYNTQTGILEQNEDANKIRHMRDLLFQGYSPEAISRMMGYKYDTTVRNALKRKTNAGIIEYDGVEYQGLHEPIFSKEEHFRILSILDARSARGQRGDGYLLAGLMECGMCHAKMRYQKWGKGLKIYCYSQQNSKKYLVKDPDCPNDRHDAIDIEAVVIDALFARGVQDKKKNHKKAETRAPADILRDQYASLRKKLMRLYDLYADGDDAILESIEERKNELAKLQRRIEVEEVYAATRQSNSEPPIDLDSLKTMWGHMDIREQRTALRECINKITITGKRVDIDFKF